MYMKYTNAEIVLYMGISYSGNNSCFIRLGLNKLGFKYERRTIAGVV